MNMYLLSQFNIFTSDIEHAYEIMQESFADANIIEGDLILEEAFQKVDETVRNIGLINLSDNIIEAIYEAGKNYIEHFPNMKASYYVNGYDSHFYIDVEDLEEYARVNDEEYGRCTTCANYQHSLECSECEEGDCYIFDLEHYTIK